MTETPNILLVPWRTGRSLGRTIYAQTGPEASKKDTLLGIMDSPVIAAAIVSTHNREITRAELDAWWPITNREETNDA